jgi:antitoxin component HigA of HigAB toxin-antitoxin module
MPLRPIRSKRDYAAALREAERLWDAPEKSAAAEQFEVLSLLIEDYERRHFPIDNPDPIDFLLNVMEWRGLSRKDLEPHIGSRARCRSAQPRPAADPGDDSPARLRVEAAGRRADPPLRFEAGRLKPQRFARPGARR